MERRIPWLWIGVAAALLLVPTSAGRLLLDVIGGLTLTLLLLPLLAGGVALIGWQLVKRRLRTCPSCGFASLGTDVCPACGSSFAPGDSAATASDSGSSPSFWGPGNREEIDARDVTINVEAVDLGGSAKESSGPRDASSS
ncbi:FYDLN acid domain-containing protein [Synechococcus sp. CCY 9618]|uniref:FYDLN acid domain-containing protein n=1 Tax=Synechococcus sp. CCY 9618 TaxID=2815602 RepID=UPI001C24FFD6|nr:FYDLN acid domain-containing protein [Synechococcus sp. CCY 9618]